MTDATQYRLKQARVRTLIKQAWANTSMICGHGNITNVPLLPSAFLSPIPLHVDPIVVAYQTQAAHSAALRELIQLHSTASAAAMRNGHTARPARILIGQLSSGISRQINMACVEHHAAQVLIDSVRNRQLLALLTPEVSAFSKGIETCSVSLIKALEKMKPHAPEGVVDALLLEFGDVIGRMKTITQSIERASSAQHAPAVVAAVTPPPKN